MHCSLTGGFERVETTKKALAKNVKSKVDSFSNIGHVPSGGRIRVMRAFLHFQQNLHTVSFLAPSQHRAQNLTGSQNLNNDVIKSKRTIISCLNLRTIIARVNGFILPYHKTIRST